MTIGYHSIPADEFTALAAGGGGQAAVRRLATAQYSKRLVLLRGVLDAGEASGGEVASRTRDAYQLLLAAYQHNPQTATAVIRHPAVGAWALNAIPTARRLLTARTPSAIAARWPTALPSWLCALAAAAAIRAGLSARIEVSEIHGLLYLPSLGAAETAGTGTAVVQTSADGTTITSASRQVRIAADPREEGPGWLPVRELRTTGLRALLDDVDPLRMPSEEPLRPRLSAAEAADWAVALRASWPRLPPAVEAEISEALTAIVPCGALRGSMSVTSPHVFGAVAMSLPPDPWSFAETLVHETAHLKLFGVMAIAELSGPDDGRRYYAPWRGDPRPVAGLLQGAYAFLAITGFWRHHREAHDPAVAFRAHTEFARWRSGAALVTRTLLASGQLTAHGREFVEGMTRTLTAWLAEPVPSDARRAAQAKADAHLAAWQRLHGPLPDEQRLTLLKDRFS